MTPSEVFAQLARVAGRAAIGISDLPAAMRPLAQAVARSTWIPPALDVGAGEPPVWSLAHPVLGDAPSGDQPAVLSGTVTLLGVAGCSMHLEFRADGSLAARAALDAGVVEMAWGCPGLTWARLALAIDLATASAAATGTLDGLLREAHGDARIAVACTLEDGAGRTSWQPVVSTDAIDGVTIRTLLAAADDRLAAGAIDALEQVASVLHGRAALAVQPEAGHWYADLGAVTTVALPLIAGVFELRGAGVFRRGVADVVTGLELRGKLGRAGAADAVDLVVAVETRDGALTFAFDVTTAPAVQIATMACAVLGTGFAAPFDFLGDSGLHRFITAIGNATLGDLRVEVAPSAGRLEVAGRGRLFDVDGVGRLRVDLADNRPAVGVALWLTHPTPRPIDDHLRQLGIDLAPEVVRFLPRVEVAVSHLTFDPNYLDFTVWGAVHGQSWELDVGIALMGLGGFQVQLGSLALPDMLDGRVAHPTLRDLIAVVHLDALAAQLDPLIPGHVVDRVLGSTLSLASMSYDITCGDLDVRAMGTLDGVGIELRVDVSGGKFVLEVSLDRARTSLTALLRRLDVLPADLAMPDVEIEPRALTIDQPSALVRAAVGVEVAGVDAELTVALQNRPSGASRALAADLAIAIGELRFELEVSAAAKRFALRLPAQALSLRALAQPFGVDLSALPFANLALASASFAWESTGGLSLAVTFDRQTSTVELAGVALRIDALRLEIHAKAAPGARRGFQVEADGELRLGAALDLAGTLSATMASDGLALSFTPGAAAKLELSTPGGGVRATIRPRPFAIRLGSDAQLTAGASVVFDELPDPIRAVVPAEIEGTLRVDAAGVTVQIDHLLGPMSVPLPDLQLTSPPTPLGELVVAAGGFKLTLGHTLAVSGALSLGLPRELNYIFGRKADGAPAFELFRTYAEGAGGPAPLIDLGIRIDDTGASIQLQQSPIKAVTFSPCATDPKTTCCEADFGVYGAIAFEVPTFRYDGAAFSASCGFEIRRPLRLPLAPLRLLLRACGLDALAATVPAAIPLQGLSLVKDGKLDVAGLEALLAPLGITLPAPVAQALVTLGDALPDALLPYLDFEVPRSLHLRLRVDEAGGFTGKITADGGVRFLTMLTDAPQLYGIDLRGIAIGEALEGSLGVFTLDASVEVFDAVEIAAANFLAHDTRKHLRHRFDVDNLVVVIVYETEIPIPIPLWCSAMAIDYLGVEGLGFGLHWALQTGRLDVRHLLTQLPKYRAFFTGHGARLDGSDPPAGLDLALIAGPTFLELPAYLGGAVLGSKQTPPPLSAWSGLASLANGVKTLALDGIVQAIPREHRTGDVDVEFPAIGKLTAGWLVTTPDEFKTGAHAALGVAPAEVSAVLTSVPPDSHGVAILLRGEWRPAWMLAQSELIACFGLLGAGKSFAVGMRVGGQLNRMVGVELSGQVGLRAGASPVAPEVHCAGRCALTLLDKLLVDGHFELGHDRLAIGGRVDLSRALPGVLAAGEIGAAELGAKGFALDAAIDWALASGAHATFALAGARVHLGSTGPAFVQVVGQWLGQQVTLALTDDGAPLLEGDVQISFDPLFHMGGHLRINGHDGTVAIVGRATFRGFSEVAATMDLRANGVRMSCSGTLFGVANAHMELTGPTLDPAHLSVTGELSPGFVTAQVPLAELHYVRFSGPLAQVATGLIQLSIDYTLVFHKHIYFIFDFHRPAESMAALGVALATS